MKVIHDNPVINIYCVKKTLKLGKIVITNLNYNIIKKNNLLSIIKGDVIYVCQRRH